MKSSTKLALATAAVVGLAAAAYAVSAGTGPDTGLGLGTTPGPADGPLPSALPLPPVVDGTAAPPIDDYERAIDAARQRGIRVWIETDLVKRWLAGKESFQSATARVAVLAKRPGVAGIKIADELGYQDGLGSADQVQRFLTDTAAALRASAPGRPLLVDLLVPELGCLPGDNRAAARSCAAGQRSRYPQLTVAAVDGYFASRTIDVVDLSTNLQTDNAYNSWGVNRDIAQQDAWDEVRRRGWGNVVRLQARKAMAHPGEYRADDAKAMLTTYVDIPRRNGAAAVDIWAWRQNYQNDIYRLADPGLKTNALWDALRDRHAAGAVLFTHFSPHSVEVGLEADLDMIATVFTDVFVAAGTG